MKLKTLFTVVSAAAIAVLADVAVAADCPLAGNWSLKLPFDSMYAGSLVVTCAGNGALEGNLLLRWASPEKTKSITVNGNKFKIVAKGNQILKGVVEGDRIKGVMTGFDVKKKPFEGWRNPPIKKVDMSKAVFGPAINLLEGGLTGWTSKEPNNYFGWSFKDGVLSNRIKRDKNGKRSGASANLVSKRADFFDFRISYDVNVPKGSNSGVYLRGRYEIQVVDSFGQKPDRHNMAALYGRIVPSSAAEKPAGEWQHVEATLYKRHLTVILNGVKIIDNAPVEGVTGGAIDANEFVPGPIYIQGDHSDADFKNMILQPILK